MHTYMGRDARAHPQTDPHSFFLYPFFFCFLSFSWSDQDIRDDIRDEHSSRNTERDGCGERRGEGQAERDYRRDKQHAVP